MDKEPQAHWGSIQPAPKHTLLSGGLGSESSLSPCFKAHRCPTALLDVVQAMQLEGSPVSHLPSVSLDAWTSTMMMHPLIDHALDRDRTNPWDPRKAWSLAPPQTVHSLEGVGGCDTVRLRQFLQNNDHSTTQTLEGSSLHLWLLFLLRHKNAWSANIQNQSFSNLLF